LLEELTVGHAEQQASVSIVDGVIVDVDAVGKSGATLAVEDGFVVAGNYFRDRNIVAALHHATGNARGIDGRVAGGYEKDADEIACIMGATDEIDLAVRRKDGLENEALASSSHS